VEQRAPVDLAQMGGIAGKPPREDQRVAGDALGMQSRFAFPHIKRGRKRFGERSISRLAFVFGRTQFLVLEKACFARTLAAS